MDGDDTGALETSSLRVVHLSPDAPAVDIFVNNGDEPVVSALSFTEGTSYLEVPAGTYSVQVAPAGGSAADAVLSVDGLTLDSGVAYTVAAYGELADISALALVDDPNGIEEGFVRLQVTHAAAGVGNVDVWELSGPTTLINDFAYGTSGSLDVGSGPLGIGLDLNEDAVPDAAFSVPSLGADTWVNVYAVADMTGPFLLAQLADGSVAIVRPD